MKKLIYSFINNIHLPFISILNSIIPIIFHAKVSPNAKKWVSHYSKNEILKKSFLKLIYNNKKMKLGWRRNLLEL